MSTASTAQPDASSAPRFTAGLYFQSLTGLLGSPRRFFTDLPPQEGLRTPFLFLLLSALFNTAASMTTISEHRTLVAAVVFLNGLIMPMAGAAAGFLTLRMLSRERAPFAALHAVYAYAGGVVLLASWIPLFVWITEPWRWVLIFVGLVKTAGLGRRAAALVLAGSILLVALFFASLAPALVALKNALG